jgi:hypothetical protein
MIIAEKRKSDLAKRAAPSQNKYPTRNADERKEIKEFSAEKDKNNE